MVRVANLLMAKQLKGYEAQTIKGDTLDAVRSGEGAASNALQVPGGLHGEAQRCPWALWKITLGFVALPTLSCGENAYKVFSG